MSKNESKNGSCSASTASAGCCNVVSIVTIDSKGQIVLPKEIRKKFNVQAGDKLAVISMNDSGGVLCCITMIKADSLGSLVKGFLGPVMENLFKTSVSE